MSRHLLLIAFATSLLSACASAPPTPPQQQKVAGWVDQFHEPRGRPECLAASGNNEDSSFYRCIHGWHERIWVDDMSAIQHPAPHD